MSSKNDCIILVLVVDPEGGGVRRALLALPLTAGDPEDELWERLGAGRGLFDLLYCARS